MTIEALHQLFLNSSGISTDTRSIGVGDLFFALKGENFNGNTFAQIALDMGASYAVVDELHGSKHDHLILVDNVLETLQDLANYHRNYLDIPIIALTGSNGKTTSKELINAVLSEAYETQATQGNLNNHIGVPLTLLQMNQSTEIGIVEMGANHIGEIAQLCEITHPNYGYITNFGKAHLEGFGGEEGVIKGKSELYNHIKKQGGIIFSNSDDSKQINQLEGYKHCITFSKHEGALHQVELVSEHPFLSVKHQGELLQTQLIGHYNFTNIAAAVAIGRHFKVDLKSIKKGIESYCPSNNRSQIISQNSNTIVLDAYNANPSSMLAALDNFNRMPSHNKLVILGDMYELGDQSFIEHQAVVSKVKNLGFTTAYFVGTHFITHQKSNPFALFFENVEALKHYIQDKPIKDTLVLVKGSRGMALERLLKDL